MSLDIDAIVENFELLDDWEDRYKYLIELGHELEEFPENQRNADNRISGCASRVWIVSQSSGGMDPAVTFLGDSDAYIVRGLISISFAIFSGKKVSEIVKINAEEYFNRISLQEHITSQRSNGLRSMIRRIRESAIKFGDQGLVK